LRLWLVSQNIDNEISVSKLNASHLEGKRLKVTQKLQWELTDNSSRVEKLAYC